MKFWGRPDLNESDKEIISLKLKLGSNELEISGSYSNVVELINLLLPHLMYRTSRKKGESSVEEEIKSESLIPPSISIKKGEPLTDILTRLFNTEWGHNPRPLKEIIDVLNAYGLYYPKSTIAVTLNRLSQRGVIRRIKTKEKHFLYVSAKPLGVKNNF